MSDRSASRVINDKDRSEGIMIKFFENAEFHREKRRFCDFLQKLKKTISPQASCVSRECDIFSSLVIIDFTGRPAGQMAQNT